MAMSFYNKDQRIFYINDIISNETLGEISQALIEILFEDSARVQLEKQFAPTPISIFINSDGGDLGETMGFIHLLDMQLAEVDTFCLGYAYSGAFKIFLAGDNRYITPTTSLMYHALSTNLPELKFGDLGNSIDRLTVLQNQIEEYVLERTKIPKEYLEKVRNEKIDWFIDFKDAIELGIATDVIDGNDAKDGESENENENDKDFERAMCGRSRK